MGFLTGRVRFMRRDHSHGVLRGCFVLYFGLVSLGLHCFLRLSSAGLIVVLVPKCCWTYSTFLLYHKRSAPHVWCALASATEPAVHACTSCTTGETTAWKNEPAPTHKNLSMMQPASHQYSPTLHSLTHSLTA